MLLAMKEDPPWSVRSRDKFLVQSMTITPDREPIPLADIVSTSFGLSHLSFYR
jgi:hypothetical protein